MNDKAFETLGKRIAALEFDRRSKSRPYRTAEAHLREMELAALLALAVEEGYKRGLAEGQRQPVPPGVMTAHGRLVALKPLGTGPKPEDVRAALESLNGTTLVTPQGERISIACPHVGTETKR